MTRWPQHSAPQGGYDGGESYGHQQYGGNNESNYGSYNPGEGYGQPTPNHQQQPYGGEHQGSAQSYYASSQQPYQQHPQNEQHNASGYNAQQYVAPSPGPPPNMQYQQHPQQPPSYGGYQEQSYPPYGQQYHPQGGQVADFRSHFEQPNAPIDPPYGQQHLPQGGQVADFRSHYEQPHGPIDPNQPYPPPGAGGAEGERGLMGALAGGAAGAYGGHKMGHGIIGGLGGAVAGSMLQDAAEKHHKKDKKDKKKRRGSNSSSSSSSSPSSSDSDKDNHRHSRASVGGGGVMAGNFHGSSHDIRLEGRSTLVAQCTDSHGHRHQSSLELNDCFTNTNGRLEWARGGNFAASAREIRLIDGGKGIECELGDGRGGWNINRVRLGERITNENGRLAML